MHAMTLIKNDESVMDYFDTSRTIIILLQKRTIILFLYSRFLRHNDDNRIFKVVIHQGADMRAGGLVNKVSFVNKNFILII